ncbi:MAG: DUF697 domain-containing protein [Xanthobacteraceae bacterium]|nr:DUF697 domain-containing protein [Xanthobacteraceae bacterium]
MNKKKFPKAVLRTADQMREAGASAASNMAAPDNVIEMIPKSEQAVSAPDVASQPPAAPTDPATALRRRKAVAIVERYANFSAVGGAIPIPLANAAAITALMVRMVKSLSSLYGVPFERTRTRTIVIALMGGALPTGFSTIATSTVSYFIPGLNLVGLAISSVTSGAYARSIGQLFIEHFENGAAVDFRSIIKR